MIITNELQANNSLKRDPLSDQKKTKSAAHNGTYAWLIWLDPVASAEPEV